MRNLVSRGKTSVFGLALFMLLGGVGSIEWCQPCSQFSGTRYTECMMREKKYQEEADENLRRVRERMIGSSSPDMQ